MADYAACYGGPPRPDTPWPLFLLLVRRAPRYEARHEIALRSAIAGSFGATSTADARQELDGLVRRAYPVKGPVPPKSLNDPAPESDTDG